METMKMKTSKIAELETDINTDVERIQLAELDSELEAALCQRNLALDRIDELERRNSERTTKLLIEINRATSAAMMAAAAAKQAQDATFISALSDGGRLELDGMLEDALSQRRLLLDHIDELDRRNSKRRNKLFIKLIRVQADAFRAAAALQALAAAENKTS